MKRWSLKKDFDRCSNKRGSNRFQNSKNVTLKSVLGSNPQSRYFASIIDMNNGSDDHNNSLSKLCVAFSAKT